MNLTARHCTPTAAALSAPAIAALLVQTPDWRAADGKLARSFDFADYYQTIAFVNALAWVAHRQDHHPELTVGYRRCAVTFSTHAAGGAVTENDFICAALADALYAARPAP